MLLESVHLQLGDLATWLAAVGTVGTLGLSVMVLRKQRAELRQLHLDKLAEQARLISAWPLDIVRTNEPLRKAELMFGYRNSSSEPAYAAEVGTRDRSAKTELIWEHLGTLAPGAEGQAAIELTLIPEYNITAEDVGVVMTFRDAAGHIWYRDEVGALIKLSYYPAPLRAATLLGSTRLRPTPPPRQVDGPSSQASQPT